MLVSILTGIPATEEQQHFTMEQIMEIVTLDADQASSMLPPRRSTLGESSISRNVERWEDELD